MIHLKTIQLAVNQNKERASESTPEMGDNPATDNLLLELYRANKLLDSRIRNILFDHSMITNKTDAQRSVQAYNEEYLLRLPMSLAALQQMVESMISTVATFKISAPPAWVRIASGTFNLGLMDSDIEEPEEDMVDSERVGADI